MRFAFCQRPLKIIQFLTPIEQIAKQAYIQPFYQYVLPWSSNVQTGTITTVYHLCEIWQDSQQQQQPPFYDHYTAQTALAGTSSSSSLQHTHPFTHTHTHPFNCPFSVTIQVSRYQKGKTNLDFTETRDSKWQWHQLGHMQVCTSLQR